MNEPAPPCFPPYELRASRLGPWGFVVLCPLMLAGIAAVFVFQPFGPPRSLLAPLVLLALVAVVLIALTALAAWWLLRDPAVLRLDDTTLTVRGLVNTVEIDLLAIERTEVVDAPWEDYLAIRVASRDFARPANPLARLERAIIRWGTKTTADAYVGLHGVRMDFDAFHAELDARTERLAADANPTGESPAPDTHANG